MNHLGSATFFAQTNIKERSLVTYDSSNIRFFAEILNWTVLPTWLGRPCLDNNEDKNCALLTSKFLYGLGYCRDLDKAHGYKTKDGKLLAMNPRGGGLQLWTLLK